MKITAEPWTCELTGKLWDAGKYLVRKAASWSLYRPPVAFPRLPFRGWCYTDWEPNGGTVAVGKVPGVEERSVIKRDSRGPKRYPQKGLLCGQCSYCEEGLCRVKLLQGQPEENALVLPVEVCSEWGSSITH